MKIKDPSCSLVLRCGSNRASVLFCLVVCWHRPLPPCSLHACLLPRPPPIPAVGQSKKTQIICRLQRYPNYRHAQAPIFSVSHTHTCSKTLESDTLQAERSSGMLVSVQSLLECHCHVRTRAQYSLNTATRVQQDALRTLQNQRVPRLNS